MFPHEPGVSGEHLSPIRAIQKSRRIMKRIQIDLHQGEYSASLRSMPNIKVRDKDAMHCQLNFRI